MNLGNFTIKAAEAVQQAQQLAFNNHHSNIETAHLLQALLQMEDAPVEYLLKKNNVTLNLVAAKLEELLKKAAKIHLIDVVCGTESRGFIMATMIQELLGISQVMIRKPSKLPGNKYVSEYMKEYGKDSLELRVGDIKPG
ncbi:MAG: hypothetical protein EAZ16_00395, partial [Sphingobacteriales bacterium]